MQFLFLNPHTASCATVAAETHLSAGRNSFQASGAYESKSFIQLLKYNRCHYMQMFIFLEHFSLFRGVIFTWREIGLEWCWHSRAVLLRHRHLGTNYSVKVTWMGGKGSQSVSVFSLCQRSWKLLRKITSFLKTCVVAAWFVDVIFSHIWGQ